MVAAAEIKQLQLTVTTPVKLSFIFQYSAYEVYIRLVRDEPRHAWKVVEIRR